MSILAQNNSFVLNNSLKNNNACLHIDNRVRFSNDALNDNGNWWKTTEEPKHSQTNEIETEEIHNTIPSSLLVCGTIQKHESKQLFKVLFDSGATHTIIHAKCLPPCANPT